MHQAKTNKKCVCGSGVTMSKCCEQVIKVEQIIADDIRDKKYKRAKKKLTNLLNQYPVSGTALNLMVRLLTQSESANVALDYLNGFLDTNPDHFHANVLAIDYCYDAGILDIALFRANRLLTIFGEDDVHTLLWLLRIKAEILFKMGNFAEAKAAAIEALNLRKSDLDCLGFLIEKIYQNPLIPEDIRNDEELAETYFPTEEKRLALRVFWRESKMAAAYNEGDFENTQIFAAEILELDENRGSAWLVLAMVKFSEGDIVKASEYILEALAVIDKDSEYSNDALTLFHRIAGATIADFALRINAGTLDGIYLLFPLHDRKSVEEAVSKYSEPVKNGHKNTVLRKLTYDVSEYYTSPELQGLSDMISAENRRTWTLITDEHFILASTDPSQLLSYLNLCLFSFGLALTHPAQIDREQGEMIIHRSINRLGGLDSWTESE